MLDQYKAVKKSIGRYWENYGGFKALISSPYLHIALILALLNKSEWYSTNLWTEKTLAVIPNILGFSIGAFAVLLAFTNDKFLQILKEDGDDKSAFISTSASFCHFILIQGTALVFASVCSTSKFYFPWNTQVEFFVQNLVSYLGMSLFYYSLLTAMTIALALMKIARVYNKA